MRDLEEILDLCQKSNNSVLLKGPHGIGKSERVESFAKEKGYHCEVLFLSHQETGDLIGIPYLENGNTVWSTPIWLQRIYDASKSGKTCVLFLDELNRARLDVRQSALQLVLCKQIHQHILPSDSLVVAASNPEDDYQVAELDPALNDRFDILEIKPNTEEWIEWARKNSTNEVVISFVADNPDKLWFKTNNENEINHPTPRSWVKVSNFMKVLEKEPGEDDKKFFLLQTFVNGKIGRSVGNQFALYWKEKQALSIESIEKAIKKIKNKKKENMNEAMDTLKPILANIEVIKLSLIAEDLLKKYIPKVSSIVSIEKAFETAFPVMAYFYSLELEVSHSILKGLKENGDENIKELYAGLARLDSTAAGTFREKEIFRRIIDKFDTKK